VTARPHPLGRRTPLIPAYYAVAAVAVALAVHFVTRNGAFVHDLVPQATAVIVLSTIASGMIAFTGVVFSLVLLAIQFGSSQYSPRLTRYLLQDSVVLHALGIFSATFLYALFAIVELGLPGPSVDPTFPTAVALVLLFASVGMFLALLGRVARLQIGSVLRMVGGRGREVIERLYPLLGPDEQPEPVVKEPSLAELPARTLTVTYEGGPAVVAAINVPLLVSLASEAGGVIELDYAVGDTLPNGAALLHLHGGDGRMTASRMRAAVTIGEERLIAYDPKYAIRLIVDIAIRALSPAINDPTTAVQALDELEDLLRRLAVRRLDVNYVHSASGGLAAIYPTPDWDDFMALAFDEIRLYGAQSLQVTRRLLALLDDLYKIVPEARKDAVKRHQARVLISVRRSFRDEEDRLEAGQEDRQGIGVTRLPEIEEERDA
jgi:uncharacterized membrane protein